MLHFLAIVLVTVYMFPSCDARRRVLHTSEFMQNSAKHSMMNYSHNRDFISSVGATRRALTPITAEDHRVTSLPGLDDSAAAKFVQYAGHIEVNANKGSSIFYWLLEKPENPLNAPLLIWLNGGPGCSSMDGLFLEIGPFRLDSTASMVRINRHSWHNVANLLVIDQPVGTGLSYTRAKDGYAGNDQAVSEQFYKFLREFFRLHPRYVSTSAEKPPSAFGPMPTLMRSRRLIMAGESHAGHYIPMMASYIRKANTDTASPLRSPTDKLWIDLDGIVLGNPWIDPMIQYDVSGYAHALGLITLGQKSTLKELNKQCQSQLRKGQLKSRVCMSLLDLVVDSSSLAGNNYAKISMYDIRKYYAKANVFPIGHEDVEKYLNRPDVRQAIHASSKPDRYVECADPPYNALAHQDGKGVLPQLAGELNAGLKLLLFSGQFDLVCNHLGSEYTLSRLNWTGLNGWLQAQRGVWIVNNKPAGYMKAYQNLMFLVGKPQPICFSYP
jgi:carboxypeptidase D